MLGATVTRPDCVDLASTVLDEQLAVSCIAGVVTFRLEDGTTIEVDDAQIASALWFVANEDAAA